VNNDFVCERDRHQKLKLPYDSRLCDFFLWRMWQLDMFDVANDSILQRFMSKLKDDFVKNKPSWLCIALRETG
jgi:hypothetical protein